MRGALSLVEDLLRRDAVRGVALVGPDGSVLETRFGASAESIAEIAGNARQILRQTAPPIRVLDVLFARGRLVVVLVGRGALLVSAEPGFEARALLELTSTLRADPTSELWGARAEEGAAAAAPAPVIVAPRSGAPPPLDHAAPGRALGLVVQEVRKTFGGLVVRNYLKRSLAELAPAHPVLSACAIDLEGNVTLPQPGPGEARALGVALGGWARALLQRAGAIDAALGSVRLRDLTRELVNDLEPVGFYGGDDEAGGT